MASRLTGRLEVCEAYEACDYSAAIRLADTVQGGGCEETDLLCIASSFGWRLTTNSSLAGTELYLSCGVGDHCVNGQRVVVRVVASPDDGSSGDGISGDSSVLHLGVVDLDTSSFGMGLVTGAVAAALLCMLVFKGLDPLLFKSCGCVQPQGAGATAGISLSRPGSSDDPSYAQERAQA